MIFRNKYDSRNGYALMSKQSSHMFFQHDVKCSVGNLLYCSVHKQLVLDLAYITVSDS